jgi:thiol-disulfide isomerase/thioredoxin
MDRLTNHRKDGFLTPRMQRAVACFWIFCFTLSMACARKEVNPEGAWRGFVKTVSGEQVAFTLDVKREQGRITGALVNGDERNVSTDGSIDGNTLTLRFNYYDGELIGKIDGDDLRGTFSRQWRKEILTRELTAKRGAPISSGSSIPGGSVTGEWVMKIGDPPNQNYWRASFNERGSEVRGTIIPVSGDWGELVGSFENGELKLNRFDGINARVFRAKLTSQGTLEGVVDLGLRNGVRKAVAERLDSKNRENIAALPDPSTYTRMNNPTEPFKFSFQDIEGKVLSSTDARFKGKVVLVTITGSWCPNCHDEAPVLQEFYQRYRDNGLEVVALAFEYTGEKERDLKQLKIFANRHGITYPILLAGTTEEGDAQRKMPQLVNFGAYPTTIYIGRDGLVKHIHAGFEGKATGERFIRLKSEMDELIKKLLGDHDV